MDPDANLQEQERIMAVPVRNRSEAEKDRLRELRDALNLWIGRGGFEPEWANCPNAARYFGE